MLVQDDHLIVGDFEADFEVLRRVYGEAAEHLGVHIGDAPGRVLQAVARGVLATRRKSRQQPP